MPFGMHYCQTAQVGKHKCVMMRLKDSLEPWGPFFLIQRQAIPICLTDVLSGNLASSSFHGDGGVTDVKCHSTALT